MIPHRGVYDVARFYNCRLSTIQLPDYWDSERSTPVSVNKELRPEVKTPRRQRSSSNMALLSLRQNCKTGNFMYQHDDAQAQTDHFTVN